MLISIRKVEAGYRLTNPDDNGTGDVIRAVDMTGYHSIPRSKPHPALATFNTYEQALYAAKALGRELVKAHGGVFDIVSPE